MRVSRARWVRPVAFVAVALFASGCGASQADGNGKSSAKGDEPTVVARVGDNVITSAELDEQFRKTNAKAYQAYYDARKQTLDQMIVAQVVQAEVDRRGITQQALQAEITAGVAPVTADEIEAFYNQNKSQMGGRTLEQMSAQIQQHLSNQRISTVMRDYITQLKKKAGVKILLEPPRSDVRIAANDPKKGPEGAPITLVEFSDYQ